MSRLSFAPRRLMAGATMLVLAGACRDKAPPATDSSLARDLALAQQNTIQPTVFNDAPIGGSAPVGKAAGAPVRKPEPPRVSTPTPRPTPRRNNPPAQVAVSPTPTPPQPTSVAPAPSPAPAAGIIGSGSQVGMSTSSRVCTGTLLPGDKLTATVTNGVAGSNGAAIPAGATVVLEVASVDRADPIEASRIQFRVRSVDVNGEPYPVSGDVANLGSMEKVQEGGGNDKTKIIGGAVAGAVLGRIFGGGTKGTVIGAAAGAAAGTIASRNSGTTNACLPGGSPLRLTVSRDIVVRKSAL